jgi:hypothetical protein
MTDGRDQRIVQPDFQQQPVRAKGHRGVLQWLTLREIRVQVSRARTSRAGAAPVDQAAQCGGGARPGLAELYARRWEHELGPHTSLRYKMDFRKALSLTKRGCGRVIVSHYFVRCWPAPDRNPSRGSDPPAEAWHPL